MGQYSVTTSEQAKKQLAAHYKAGNIATIKRIENIFEDLANHPYLGVGRPEPLKYELSEYWSRELNKKDRLVYQVNNQSVSVAIVSAMGHYGDK